MIDLNAHQKQVNGRCIGFLRLKQLVTLWVCLSITPLASSAELKQLFDTENLRATDSVLVTQIQDGAPDTVLYEWQIEKALIPASLAKLATSYLAIQKWGLDKRFHTDFYRQDSTLWVKGYGDPYLVSEELDLVASALQKHDLESVRSIAIDNSFFSDHTVPGRTQVVDPYNAPLAAVSANFNTVKLQNSNGQLQSAEPQTPLTEIAKRLAKKMERPLSGKTERINLINADNAAQHFGQILAHKLDLHGVSVHSEEAVSSSLPDDATLLYQHINTHSLADIIRGTLEYSNNFMANQLFLMMVGQDSANFTKASNTAEARLKHDFSWQGFALEEGAGLSRKNRLTAKQINQLLSTLEPAKRLFKRYDLGHSEVTVLAKTGTLNGIRSFAGFIEIKERRYQFVFNFNRKVPYKYRESLLKKLVAKLVDID